MLFVVIPQIAIYLTKYTIEKLVTLLPDCVIQIDLYNGLLIIT